ncbi:hypothetical protein PAXRUDRAFT_504358 [Paxillus rubicundulus Ve08.2h10]|uniref:Uncharacterized protein n=1 Tax=Paxillus rubicundulus Ve08.2h10 TaxID=930991 RepID=A0A0D0DCP2_9AGAM|nr:hypothetical protein PAXRUDRAFT_504358 [Paxillus rubicundulus Ve08.2h10]
MLNTMRNGVKWSAVATHWNAPCGLEVPAFKISSSLCFSRRTEFTTSHSPDKILMSGQEWRVAHNVSNGIKREEAGMQYVEHARQSATHPTIITVEI